MTRVLILPVRIHGVIPETDSYKITTVIIRTPNHLLYPLRLPHPPTVGLANLVLITLS
jgi:hypothetical protein